MVVNNSITLFPHAAAALVDAVVLLYSLKMGLQNIFLLFRPAGQLSLELISIDPTAGSKSCTLYNFAPSAFSCRN